MKSSFLFLCFYLAFLPSGLQATPSSPASLNDIPLIGRYIISAGIGEDQTQYHVKKDGDNFIFHNQTENITALISDSGVQVTRSSYPFTLKLSQFGYGEILSAVPEANLHSRKNRVELQRGSITEWYVNGPLGLQQGFTLSRPPQQQVNQEMDSELHLTLSMEGLRGKLSPDGMNMALLNSSSETVMQYGGLTTFDTNGLELPTRLAVTDNTLHIYVDDRTASYPIVIDPLFQNARLTQDGEANDEKNLFLGCSVAINNTTVVVGAFGYHDDLGVANRGAVYIYTKADTGWAAMSQTARLLASDGVAEDDFGHSVAISSADHIIIVGAPGFASSSGKVYLFMKPTNVIGGNRWLNNTEDAVLTNFLGGSNDGAEFGESVAINNNGDIVVGRPNDLSPQGSAYVFPNPGFPDHWGTDVNYTASSILNPDLTAKEFGKSVAIDNHRIVVGAPGEKDKGAAYYFSKSPSESWLHSHEYTLKLESGDIASQDTFGNAVAINGSTIAVGAPNHGVSGAAYLFNLPTIISPGSLHTHTTKFLADSVVDNANFGHSIAMNDSMVVVGTPYQDIDGTRNQGQIHLFSKPGSGWPTNEAVPVEITEDAHLTCSDDLIMGKLGWSVAIASDNSVASGAMTASPNNILKQGMAYVFIENTSTEAAKLTVRQDLSDDQLGSAVAVSGDTVVVGAPGHNTKGSPYQGAAYVFSKQSKQWTDMTPAAILYARDGIVGDGFGKSLDISNDTVVVGAPNHDFGGDLLRNQGAAYIFSKPIEGWSGMLPHTAKLSSLTGAAGETFGFSVAIDGQTVIVGAPSEGDRGAVHLFDNPTGQPWSDKTKASAKLVASDIATDDRFGQSISISNDTVVVGAPGHDSGGNTAKGAAYVFVEPSNGWDSIWSDLPETARLSVSEGGSYYDLGISVGISDDTIVTGARTSGSFSAAFVFQKPGTVWSNTTIPTAKLTPSDSDTQPGFSGAVSISSDIIVCGALRNNSEQGAAYLFKKHGSAWTDSEETEKLVADDGQASDWLGKAVATDGETIIVGAPHVDVNGTDRQGAAYIFDIRKIFPWAMFLPAINGSDR